MNTLQLIIDKLRSAFLPDSQISLWTEVLDNSSEESLKDILAFIDADEKAISILTDNLLAKEEAIRSGDIEKFEQVLKNDAATINSL